MSRKIPIDFPQEILRPPAEVPNYEVMTALRRDQQYGGWSNYATYLVKRIIDDDENFQHWRLYATLALRTAPGDLMVERMGAAVFLVSDSLRFTFGPIATSNVNWMELAEELVIEVSAS